MNLSKITAVALAASLGLASLASAQPYGGPGRDQRPGARHPHAGPSAPARGMPQHAQPRMPAGPTLHHPGRPMPPTPPMARGAGPDHRFYKGQRLPAEWRHRQNVVNDWRGHHLTPPPRGQQWVQVGADFALVAIATGVITSLILNN